MQRHLEHWGMEEAERLRRIEQGIRDAGAILERPRAWMAVSELADALILKNELTGPEVVEIIDQALGAG